MPRHSAHAAARAAVLAAALSAGSAAAHGAFPESRQVMFRESSDAQPVVLTTFGVIIPESPGIWRWICEEVASGAVVTQLVALPSGRTLLATGAGLVASDDLCSWAWVEGETLGASVSQLSLSSLGEVWVSAWNSPGVGALWRSTDDGRTFEAQWTDTFGPDRQLTGFLLAEGGEPALVAGVDADAPALWWRQGDGWILTPIEDELADAAYPLGLSAAGDRAWVALRNGGGDAIVEVSPQGEQLLRAERGAVNDFLLGFADRGDALYVAGKSVGLLRSTDAGATWAPVGDGEAASCIHAAGGALYQCTDNYLDGASVLRHSGDPSEGEAVLTFGQIRSTLSCPAGTTVKDTCEPLWPLVQVYGLGGDPTPTPTPTVPTPTPGEDARCGCADSGAEAWLLVAPLALLAALRRRRMMAPARP